MLEENPHNAWTAYNLALALEAMKNLKGAEDELLRAVGIDSKLAKPRAELGRLRLTAGDLPGAEKWLESALELDPQSAEARGDLAMVRAKEGDLVVAEKLLRQALEDDPNYTEGSGSRSDSCPAGGRRSMPNRNWTKRRACAPGSRYIVGRRKSKSPTG